MDTDNQQSFFIPGTAGEIEASVCNLSQDTGRSVIVCHPHPQYGGNMHDGVVSLCCDYFAKAGATVVRFNFRGVGSSTGKHSNGPGECDDLHSVMQWLFANKPQDDICLVGYSFGSWIVSQVLVDQVNKSSVNYAILIAPPLTYMDYPAVEKIAPPVSIILGSDDNFASEQEAIQWVGDATQVQTILGADHFFGGCYDELNACLHEATKL